VSSYDEPPRLGVGSENRLTQAGTVTGVSPASKPTHRQCSVSDALATVGDRYTLEIVRELFYGNTRFVDLIAEVGAPRSVLSSRLSRLHDAGVVRRRRYSDRPPRDEYVLTDAGSDLAPVLLALKQWGDRWCRHGVQTAEFTHSCGALLHAQIVCAACGKPIQFEDLTVSGGTHPPTITAGRGDTTTSSDTSVRTSSP
jgi:DNA-binding HxlR family transcriptional regulator